jgi:hypothetical protein
MRAVAVAVALVSSVALAHGTAAAQVSPEWRVRGGIGFESGPFIVPGLHAAGSADTQGQLGAQRGPLGLYRQPLDPR